MLPHVYIEMHSWRRLRLLWLHGGPFPVEVKWAVGSIGVQEVGWWSGLGQGSGWQGWSGQGRERGKKPEVSPALISSHLSEQSTSRPRSLILNVKCVHTKQRSCFLINDGEYLGQFQ